MTTTQDTTSRALETIVSHLTATGFARIPENEIPLYLTEADNPAGFDLYADDKGAMVYWDAEGNLGASSTMCDCDALAVEDLNDMTIDDVIAWLVEATR